MHNITDAIEFRKLVNEDQLLEAGLDAFSASFDHNVTRLFPIWTAYSGDRIIAYCHVHKQAVAYPAVHPDITPRMAYCLANAWVSRLKRDHGDPLMHISGAFEDRLFSKMNMVPFRCFKVRD